MNISESEFNRLFLKNLFKEFIVDAEGHFAHDELEKMATILTTIFVNEFGYGKTPTQLVAEHKNIEAWLEKQIENFRD